MHRRQGKVVLPRDAEEEVRPRAATQLVSLAQPEECPMCLEDCSTALPCHPVHHVICAGCCDDWWARSQKCRCEYCQHAYGVEVGEMPDGELEWWTEPFSLAGYPDTATLCLGITLFAGALLVDGEERAFPRRALPAFLPDVPKGRQLLQFFVTAFKRRVLLTGPRDPDRSNRHLNLPFRPRIHIPLKTDKRPDGEFGWPDARYFAHARGKLVDAGVNCPELDMAEAPLQFFVTAVEPQPPVEPPVAEPPVVEEPIYRYVVDRWVEEPPVEPQPRQVVVACWFWQEDAQNMALHPRGEILAPNSNWVKYPVDVSEQIERNFQRTSQYVSLAAGSARWQLDLERGVQRNLQTHKERRIWRQEVRILVLPVNLPTNPAWPMAVRVDDR